MSPLMSIFWSKYASKKISIGILFLSAYCLSEACLTSRYVCRSFPGSPFCGRVVLPAMLCRMCTAMNAGTPKITRNTGYSISENPSATLSASGTSAIAAYIRVFEKCSLPEPSTGNGAGAICIEAYCILGRVLAVRFHY